MTRRMLRGLATVPLTGLVVATLLMVPFTARPTLAAEAEAPSVSEITADPEQFYGETVVVTGNVQEALGDRAFTIEDANLLSTEEILVVTARPMLDTERETGNADLMVTQDVRVTGTVHQFNAAAFQDQFGVSLDLSQFQEWRGRPAIVARSLVVEPPSLLPGAATVDSITDDPTSYYGRTVTVTAEVNRVLGPQTFTVDDNDLLADEELLVVAALPMPQADDRPANGRLREDTLVRLTGFVRPFEPAEIEADIGLQLDESLLNSWIGRPSIVVRSIQAPVR